MEIVVKDNSNSQIYNKNLILDSRGYDILFTIFVEKSAIMFEDFRLKVFLTVAKERSFTKAASVLGVTQPSVSQNIAELEKQLGTRLFDRLRGEVVMLPAGRIFKEYAEQILKTYDCAFEVLAKFPETVVRISSSDDVYDYLTTSLLQDFIELHTEVTFEKAFLAESDLRVVLLPDDRKKGVFALSYHPSCEFSKTRLWTVLSQFLEQEK